MNKRSIGGSLVTLIMVLGTGTLANTDANAEEPLGFCGNGHQLIYNPFLESFLADVQQDNVNFDGYVCVNSAGADNGGRGFIVITDNNRQGPPS